MAALLYLLFLLSGAAGLIYELVWVRELVLVFGGTTYAITTVLVAFMGGLGLGSFLAGRWSRRLQQAGLAYGCLELGIGLYALLVPVLLNLAQPAYRALYPHVSDVPALLTVARFLLCGLILVVPTTCMGATLPVLVRFAAQRGQALGAAVGYLYGINTLGAVLGVLGAGFWLIPTFGLTLTTSFAAALNLVVGTLGVLVLRAPQGVRQPAGPERIPAPTHAKHLAGEGSPSELEKRADSRAGAGHLRAAARAAAEPVVLTALGRRILLTGFALSGLAAMVYQITWTRALVLSLGSSTYSFTCILAAFILGLAVGSIAIARWVDRLRRPLLAFGVLELLIGLVAVAIVPVHGQVPLIVKGLVAEHTGDFVALLRLQFLLVIAVTFVPTFLMGAIFPLVTRTLARSTHDVAEATGRAYAVNTLGTIAGSLLAGFVLIRSDVLGVQNSIVLASVLNATVGLLAILTDRPVAPVAWTRRAALPTAALLATLALGAGIGRWDPRVLTTGPFLNRGTAVTDHEILYFGEGVDATVAVARSTTKPDLLTLTVNGKPDASNGTGDMPTQLLLGHLPALVAPQPRSACLIGLGSGITLSALAQHAALDRIDCIEISAEVMAAAAYFKKHNRNLHAGDPRVRILRADGRNHLLLANRSYDLIVSEPSNPWIAGVASLFTREFFALGRQRLTADGRMVVWLHSYSMSRRDFQMVVRTITEVFDYVTMWVTLSGDYLLVGSTRPQTIDWTEFQCRFRQPAVQADLAQGCLHRPAQIVGRFIAGEARLRAWAAAAPLHTDDNALLEFSAPRYVLQQEMGAITWDLGQIQEDAVQALCRPPEGMPPRAVAEITNVMRARAVALQSEVALAQGHVVTAAALAVEAYLLDPSSDAWRDIGELTELVDARAARGDSEPGLADIRSRLQRLLPPLAARPDETLSDLANRRRARAYELFQRGDFAGEVTELLEALRLDPHSRATAIGVVDAMRRAGHTPTTVIATCDDLIREQPDAGGASYVRAAFAVQVGDFNLALSRLEVALYSGAIAAAALAQDERFAALRDDPRFVALITE